jgi:hypothetical protein
VQGSLLLASPRQGVSPVGTSSRMLDTKQSHLSYAPVGLVLMTYRRWSRRKEVTLYVAKMLHAGVEGPCLHRQRTGL